jgi:hypothetical protein
MVQKRAGSRMDVLLLGLIDYPRRVEAAAFMSMRAADAALPARSFLIDGEAVSRMGTASLCST